MRIYLFIACLMGSCVMCHAQKQVTLDITDGITWKEIFDSGFRPKHLSDGIYMCRQYDVDLRIKSPSGELLHLGRGDVDFSVKEGGLVVLVSYFGRQNRTLEEAKIKSAEFSKMFGESVTKRATLKTFQNKHEVDYSGRKINPPQIEEHVDLKTTTNAAKVGDFRIIYGFSDSYLDDLPLVERLSVALKSKEAKRAKRLTEKIRPPVGYEHISLEPNQETEEPEKRVSKGESRQEQDDVRSSQSRKKQELESDEAVEEKLSNLPWIIAGVLLVGILALLFKTFKGKSAS